MELKEWYVKVLKQYTDFSGRARRREYWMFILANFIVCFVLGIISALIPKVGAVIQGLYSVAVLIPTLAVGVRRLHDTGKSGWYLLVSLIPLVGGIWLLVLLCQDSQAGANQWGENPKGLM